MSINELLDRSQRLLATAVLMAISDTDKKNLFCGQAVSSSLCNPGSGRCHEPTGGVKQRCPTSRHKGAGIKSHHLCDRDCISNHLLRVVRIKLHQCHTGIGAIGLLICEQPVKSPDDIACDALH